MGKTGKILGGVVAGVVIIAAAASCNDDSGDSMAKTDPPAVSVSSDPTHADSKDGKQHTKAPVSQATTFRNCVAKNGSAAEKAAVQHVTKVTGTENRNDILDAPEVYTDFKGGIMSSNQGKAKLIASAFASCYDSNNGLVTVYGADGQMMANGNF